MSGDYGAVLKHNRTTMNLSLRTVAKRAGITPSHLLRIERSESEPSLGIAARLCDVLQISLDDLAGRRPPTLTRVEALLAEALAAIRLTEKPPL